MNKTDKKNFLVLPTILVLFVLGSISYFTKSYTSAVFYSVLLIIYVLINILIKLDMLCEYTKSILYSFFKKELDKSKENLEDLKRLSDEIAKELEEMRDRYTENNLKANELIAKEKSTIDTLVDEIVDSVDIDAVVDTVVEEALKEAPKKRRGRPKKSEK